MACRDVIVTVCPYGARASSGQEYGDGIASGERTTGGSTLYSSYSLFADWRHVSSRGTPKNHLSLSRQVHGVMVADISQSVRTKALHHRSLSAFLQSQHRVPVRLFNVYCAFGPFVTLCKVVVCFCRFHCSASETETTVTFAKPLL